MLASEKMLGELEFSAENRPFSIKWVSNFMYQTLYIKSLNCGVINKIATYKPCIKALHTRVKASIL